MNSFLYRIEAPHYVAGVVVENFYVVRAAPILRWAVGKPWSQVQIYLVVKKRYSVELIN